MRDRSSSGETDSERVFALITKETRAADGDVSAGIAAAARWIADDAAALRVEHRPCREWRAVGAALSRRARPLALERAAGGPSGHRHLEHSSAAGRIRVRAGELADRPSVVVASERMDEDSGWRNLEAGVLMHVARDLTVDQAMILDGPPRHQLTLEDLADLPAASQAA